MKKLLYTIHRNNKKKKIVILILIQLFIVFFAFFGVNSITVSADEKPSDNEQYTLELNERIEELLGELDLSELQAYVDSLDNFTNESVAERLTAYIAGEKFDYESFGSEILQILFEKVRQVLPAFTCIAAIALLSGLISTLRSGNLGGSAANMIFMISYVAALIPLIGVLTECFQETSQSVSSMQKQMHIVFPLMLTLMAASVRSPWRN